MNNVMLGLLLLASLTAHASDICTLALPGNPEPALVADFPIAERDEGGASGYEIPAANKSTAPIELLFLRIGRWKETPMLMQLDTTHRGIYVSVKVRGRSEAERDLWMPAGGHLRLENFQGFEFLDIDCHESVEPSP